MAARSRAHRTDDAGVETGGCRRAGRWRARGPFAREHAAGAGRDPDGQRRAVERLRNARAQRNAAGFELVDVVVTEERPRGDPSGECARGAGVRWGERDRLGPERELNPVTGAEVATLDG